VAACGGKVVGVDTSASGGSSGTGSSSGSSGGTSPMCEPATQCGPGNPTVFEVCTADISGTCIVYAASGGASFACRSCRDCTSARANVLATVCGGTPNPGPQPSPPPPPPVVDASVPLACPPLASIGNFTPTWKPPAAHQSACSQANIDNFEKFCLGTGDQQTCNSFLATAAGKTCANCILTPATAAAWGPLIDHSAQGFVSLNTPGCLALKQGNDTCAKALSADEQCTDAACVNCRVTDEASLLDFDACVSAAKGQACAAYAKAASCADAPIAAGLCPSEDAGDFAAGYEKLVPIFCLAP
jgi:hypothetical protein